jgi:hypothetical protein
MAEVRQTDSVEACLAKVLEDLGVSHVGLHRHRGTQAKVNATEGPASQQRKARRPVSAETRAKMKAAWARRNAEQHAPSAGDVADGRSTGK